MIDVRRVSGDEWELVRNVRLEALRDTPDWFWATAEDEERHPESWWRDLIAAGGWFIALADDRPVGIAAAISHPRFESNTRTLISMWVHPEMRRSGIGRRLVAAAIDFARADGAETLQLEVTEQNSGAARLYESLGFRRTGATVPLPRDPSLIEHEMVLDL